MFWSLLSQVLHSWVFRKTDGLDSSSLEQFINWCMVSSRLVNMREMQNITCRHNSSDTWIKYISLSYERDEVGTDIYTYIETYYALYGTLKHYRFVTPS